MKARYLSIYILAGMLFTSCHKYLDVKPKGTLIPTTVSDFDHMLDNASTVEFYFQDNNRGSLVSYLSDNMEVTEGQAKAGFVIANNPNIGRYYAHIFRQPYTDPNSNDYYWSTGSQGVYSQMMYFNNVIKGISSIPNKSVAEQDLAASAIAQARTARGWAYFNLNLLYGPVYKPGGNNNTPTIPYVTSPDLSEPMPMLSSSEQVMQLVADELYAALPDLPADATWPSRANKAAGQTMMAYYHLFTQKYDSVVYYANLAWTSSAAGDPSKVLYDYNLFDWTNPANLVSSLITSPQDLFVNAVNNREMLLYRGMDMMAGQATQLSYPSAELIALFDQTNDLRFKYYFISAPGYKTTLGGGYDDGTRISNYRYNKMRPTDGFTYPELLLIRAEGYARTNQLTLAIADLNTLRRYRYKTGTPQLTAGSQDQVIQAVLDERRRELPVGGIKRFMDLKRFVVETGKPWSKQAITHHVGAETFTGRIDSKDFILNIPNTVLKYNPAWNIPLDTRPFQ